MQMRNLTKLTATMMIFATVLSACFQPAKETTGNKEEKSSTNQAAISGDPSVKYEPAVELSIGRPADSTIQFDEGENYDKNAVYDAYLKDMGIKIVNKWIVNSEQYEEKVRLSITSNDIPDLFNVNISELQQLVESDMVMDLTELFDKYASEETKQWFQGDGGKQLDSAKFNGKLMAIPFTDSPYNYSSYIWLRKDWLKKLNLPEPKTMQDVLKIAEAFTTKDPDGNNKADTYGLAVEKNIYGSAYGLTGLFNGYHAYPAIWVKDKSGKLVYGSVQPEMKAALKQLQDMYKAGQIDKEFIVKDPDKENELVANDKIGMAYGLFWLGSWPLLNAAVKDGKVTQDWEVYPLASIDDKPAMTQVGLGVSGYYVVSKNSKNPEAVIKILNKQIQMANKLKEEDKVYQFGKSLKEENKRYWKLNPIVLFNQTLNIKAGEVVPKAIEAKDPSILGDNQDLLKLYNDSHEYLNGNTKLWNSWMKAKPHGSLQFMNQYHLENRYITDEFYGAPTPSMIQKKGILDQKETEVFTKIITNQLPVDEFDKFVSEWNDLGGDDITEEVNEWYADK